MSPSDDPSVARILQAVESAASNRRLAKAAALFPLLRAFVATGDETILPAATAASRPVLSSWWDWTRVFDALAAPGQLGTGDRRLLAFVRAAGLQVSMQYWLDAELSKEETRPDAFQQFARELGSLGWTPSEVALLWAELICQSRHRDAADTRQRWFLALEEPARQEVFRQAATAAGSSAGWLLGRCVGFAPGSVRRFLDESPSLAAGWLTLPLWKSLVDQRADLFAADAARALDADTGSSPRERFRLAAALHAADPVLYRDTAIARAREHLRELNAHETEEAARWLADHLGAAVIPEFVELVHEPPGKYNADRLRENLLQAATTLGRDAAQPVLAAYLESAPVEERTLPIKQLLAWDDPAARAQAQAAVAAGLSAPQNPLRVWYVEAVQPWMLPALEPHLWKLLEDSSKLAREAAARALSDPEKGSTNLVPRAAGLLAARRATTRLGAVYLLARRLDGADAEAARAALRARLETEADETVREALLKALPDAVPDPAATPDGVPATREAVHALIARAAAKLTGPPVSWLDEKELPPLFLAGEAEPLPPAAARFLLHRQARGKVIAADAQARPLLDALDRARSGDFALAVLRGFLASPQEAKDRWALAVAGLLGDGRALRLLARQIPDWVDNQRGKLAEYATAAIALPGTDEALLALDALAIRYRSRNKNVGTAASAAFARAADARGLTTDELGDRVIPWLGFPPEGGPRVVTVADRRIEVRVGLDFKLSMVDADSRKKVASWPAATPPEIKAEMKEVAAALRDAAKAQTLRMEHQFVRQRRWPAARWRERFLAHPLLVPFAVQLVWGEYADADARKGPRSTFRALPDGTLTDARDESPALGSETWIGSVHPLELDPETLGAWRTHLDDYAVQPSFPQLDRPVVRVAPEQAGGKSLADAVGAELNALTFKSRAEKRGWTRGSVNDGGSVWHYVKRFGGAGVDVFLELDGFFVGAGMDDTVTLGKMFFVRADSVKTGGYTDDEPKNDQDPRLLALGDVPPVVLSETAGDARLIAGRVE